MASEKTKITLTVPPQIAQLLILYRAQNGIRSNGDAVYQILWQFLSQLEH